MTRVAIIKNNTLDQERARIKSGCAVQRITGCWLWIGCHSGNGYGMMKCGDKMVNVHRKSHELFNGSIAEGMQIDHLCRNRACCNPDHLEAVTCRENLLRGQTKAAELSKRTHCKRGHEFTLANTKIKRTGHRQCRKCLCILQAGYVRAKWNKSPTNTSEHDPRNTDGATARHGTTARA